MVLKLYNVYNDILKRRWHDGNNILIRDIEINNYSLTHKERITNRNK